MRVSFRNCREIWKQVSEIVEKGGFFQFVESRIKLLIGWARRWYAYEWLSHGHLMAQFDCILLCCFWFFTKELCIIIKIKVRECSFENQFTACHYKPGLVCFLPHFSLRVQLFLKERNYSVTHDGVESFLFLKECFYALAFSQDMYQVLHHQDSAKTTIQMAALHLQKTHIC